jgi:hypothetical protein
MKKKLYDFEFTLEWVGKGRMPARLESEYGFGTNPPVIIRAETLGKAKKQLNLPKNIRIGGVICDHVPHEQVYGGIKR